VENVGWRGFGLSDDIQVAEWLDAHLRNELDLRQSRGLQKEIEYGPKTPRIIILDQGDIAGYAEMRKISIAIELATVLVDPKLRGKGYSHQLVHQAWERWRQDPVLHRSPLGGEVDLVRGDKHPQIVQNPLISFTRNPAMAAALVGGGFTMIPKKRRASRLWLWKSDFAVLPIRVQVMVAFDRLVRGTRFLFSSPNRIMHYLRHSKDYRLFVRIPETADRPPPRMHMRSEREGGVSSDVMDQMEAVGFTMAEVEPNPAVIAAWDEGE